MRVKSRVPAETSINQSVIDSEYGCEHYGEAVLDRSADISEGRGLGMTKCVVWGICNMSVFEFWFVFLAASLHSPIRAELIALPIKVR